MIQSRPSPPTFEMKRINAEFRPFQYLKAKVANHWRIEDFRYRWDDVKYAVSTRKLARKR